MFYNYFGKAVLIMLSLSLASNAVYKFYLKKKKKVGVEINEVIMFRNGTSELRESKYSRRKLPKSMDRLLHYINSPRYSLDICIYIMTNTDILNVILKLHIRGVKIRVILDADMAFSNASGLKRLERQGIPVRWMKSTNLMHHKFCLIDASVINQTAVPVVVMGSLNWTNQGFFGNWEDVVVTSQVDLVRQYKNEFERLWLQFKSIVD